MKTERSNAALVGGSLLIGFGLLALASQLFRDSLNWSLLWPFSVILIGVLFFAGMFLGGRSVSGLAIPGAIITGIGLMLLYQSLTSHWESWAYAWTLILLLVGVGIYIAGAYGRSDRQKRSGLKLMELGFILFVIFGAFFEGLFSAEGGLGFRSLLFPVLLILLGVYLILRRQGVLGSRGKSDAASVTPSVVPPPDPPANTQ
jgi:peptidoglycan/LPS O-acetylase OafA/YrhL